MINKEDNSITTEFTKLWLREDGILQTACEENTKMTLDEATNLTQAHIEITNGTPTLLLCDITDVVDMPKSCRDYFAGKAHCDTFTACALITNSIISKVIGNFFLGLNKPLKPTKLFSSENEALSWLNSLGK